MALDITRRGLITGLISFAAAPAIVRAQSLMPIKVMEPDVAWSPFAFGKSRMWALFNGRGLYEIWWEPGEDTPRIRNVTPESCEQPKLPFVPVPAGD